MRILGGLVVIQLLITATTTFAADGPSAEELLATYQKSVDRLDRVQMTVARAPREFKQGRGSGKESFEMTIARENARWKLTEILRTTTTAEDGKQSERAGRVQTLIGSEFLSAQSSEPTRKNPKPRVSLSVLRGEHPGGVWWALGASRALFGRAVGDAGKPLWEVMTRDSNLERLPGTETISDHETVVVTSQGKYGGHRVWLDVNNGCLPRRIEIRKQKGDLFDDEELGSRPAQANSIRLLPRVPGLDPLAGQEIVIRIDKVRIEEQAGVALIRGFNESTTTTDAYGREFERREEYRVQQIDIDPEPRGKGEFQFDQPIPNGTPVVIFDQLPIGIVGAPTAYGEWLNGNVRVRGRK